MIETALQFQVHPHEEKCIQVDFMKGAVVQSNFSISPELYDGKLFVRVFYLNFDEVEEEVAKQSSQSDKSLAFIAPEDSLYSFCFTDRPRKGTWIEEDRYVTFTWASRHDEVDALMGKWDAEDKLAPVEKLLQKVEHEADEMLVEVKHRRIVVDEFRQTMETLESRFWWLGFTFFTTLIALVVGQTRYTVMYLKKKKIID